MAFILYISQQAPAPKYALREHYGELRLPREEIQKYAFVLEPLAEIVPDHRHPELDLSYAGMWRHFPGQRDQTRIPFDFD